MRFAAIFKHSSQIVNSNDSSVVKIRVAAAQIKFMTENPIKKRINTSTTPQTPNNDQKAM